MDAEQRERELGRDLSAALAEVERLKRALARAGTEVHVDTSPLEQRIAKPRNPRHLDIIEAGRDSVSDTFCTKQGGFHTPYSSSDRVSDTFYT